MPKKSTLIIENKYPNNHFQTMGYFLKTLRCLKTNIGMFAYSPLNIKLSSECQDTI